MSLGENIRRLRMNKGMTQGELAIKCNVQLGQISKIERDEVDARISTIEKIREALNCSADNILMNAEKIGVGGVLKEAMEAAEALPDDDKLTLIKIIEKFCIANGLNIMFKNHRILIDISKEKDRKELPKFL